MPTTRRNLFRLSAATIAALALRKVRAGAEPLKPLHILILGGTGFIGPHQVRYALARGHKVTLFNRGRQKKEWPGEVEELLGDRNTGDLKALHGREWDVCIDNPTTLPFWVRDAGHVLRGKVKQYIFISTISVYAANDKPGADESAALLQYSGKDAMAETEESFRPHLGELYGPLKAASEAQAANQFASSTTIVRPGLIVGPGDQTDRFTYWPVRLARGGEVLAPGDGSDPVQFIDARDLAEWIIRAAELRTFGTFNATGPREMLTTRGMLADIGAAVHSDAQLTWIPTKFLEEQKVEAWSDLPVWVPGQGDSAGFARRSVKKALAAGLTFRPLSVTAAETLAWFREQPADRQAKLHAGLTQDREAAILAAWHRQGNAQ
ncbi:MAG: NAD-dependent epimerase/dehydratase family protein [Rudaea sp.]|nr:NAD-dependent epimerase/dehydratase family protein [Rudaea sp.]